MRFALAAALGLALFSTTADARGRHARPSHSQARSSAHARAPARVVHARPVVHVAVGNPWAPTYVPPSRSGYIWVAGYHSRGVYMPGYWQPTAAAAPGMVWVPGYWNGRQYVDGYWRQDARSGYVWTDGYYDRGGTWVSGTWSARGGSVSVGASVGNVDIAVHAPVP